MSSLLLLFWNIVLICRVEITIHWPSAYSSRISRKFKGVRFDSQPPCLSNRPTNDKKSTWQYQLRRNNYQRCHSSCEFSRCPFGGVGGSGHGYYHGTYGFQTFSHLKTTVSPPKWFDRILAFRYLPYSARNKAKIPKTKATFKRCETIQDQRVKRTRFLGLKFMTGLALQLTPLRDYLCFQGYHMRHCFLI